MQENKTNTQTNQPKPTFHSNITEVYIPLQLLSTVYDKASDLCYFVLY